MTIDPEREARDRANWDAFEDWWEAEVQLRMERIEARAEVLIVTDLCGRMNEARFRNLQRAEDELMRAGRRAEMARKEYEESIGLLETAIRLAARQE